LTHVFGRQGVGSTVGSAKKERRTKGGEALTEMATVDPALSHPRGDATSGESERPGARWHVLWTHSNYEQLVYDQLTAKGFRLFLPKLDAWSRRGGVHHLSCDPMFRGYLFLYHVMDKLSYIEVCSTNGLVRILGERWDRLETVPDREIEGIQRVLGAGLLVLPYAYLRKGQRVRITRGPLADVEGILVQSKPKKGLLVLSVDLLQRSVAVHVDCTLVTAA
jgi:transcriptional antiterminator NusG